MNRFSGQITPTFSSAAGRGPYEQLDPNTLALLEALITKTPGGMLQTTMDTASDIGNVLGSMGQLNKAEEQGRQLRRALPNIVDAVSSDPGGTYDAMISGLEQSVLDRGLGAVMGVEDIAIPGYSMMAKLGAAGTALGMAAPIMGKRTRQQLIKEIAKSGSRPEANKILEASAREYGYDPDLIEATRQYRPTGGPATPTDMFDTVETPSQNASPAARRREALRGNPELAGYKAGQAPGESILTYDDVSQRPVVQPEEMVGGVLVPMQGDRTDRVLVEQVSGIPLKRPVKVEAGPNFPFGRDDFAWASNYNIVKGFQNKARLAADATGKPVYAGYVAMGADSGNFSTPVIEIMLNQLDAIQIPKKEIQNINRIINKALVAKGYPEGYFVGIDSPNAMAQLLGVEGPTGKQYPYGGSGQLRKAVIEAVSKKNVYDLGFPSLRDVTYDITQPNLRNVETSDAGATIVRLDPYAPLRDSNAPRNVEHRSYDTGIPGSDMGRMEQVDIPAPIMFPQSYGRAKDMVNKGKSGNPLTQSQQFKNVVSATDQYEVLDQQWLDGVRSWMERTKSKDIGTMPTLAFLLLGAGGLNAMASDDPEMQAAGGAMMGAAAMGGVPKFMREAAKGAMTARGARSAELAAEQIARGDNIEAAEYNRLSAESTRLLDRAKAVIQDRLKNNRDREGMYGGEAAKMDEEIARQTEEIDTLVKRQEATIHREFLNRELDDVEKARFDRAVKQGFDIDAFHGTKGDISIFDPGLLGTTTTAPSARKGFFFAAEPETANAYAKGSDPIDLGRATREDIRRAENDIESEIQKIGDRMAEIEQSVRSKTNFYDKVNDIVDRKSAGALSNSEAEYEMDLLEREIQLEAFNDFAYANMANKKENLIQQRMTAGSKIGNNIMPVKLRIQNPFEYDFKGLSYRDISYDSLIDRAKEAGHDGAIFRNTKDGGPVTDVYVVFDPAQIRSRFATFDPDKMGSSDILSSIAPVLFPVGAGAAAAAYTVNNE